MKNSLRILFFLTVFSGFVFSGNANALRFNGESWLAHQYSNGIPEKKYFLVINAPGITKAKLKGFALEPASVTPNFAGLIDSMEEDNVTWWQIDTESSKVFRKLFKKAARKYKKFSKKGKIDLDTDRQAWMDEWVEDKLENRKFKLKLWGENGKKLKTKAVYVWYENPNYYDYEDQNDEHPNNGVSPVPEPATLLLLGSGLIGLAAAGKKKLFNK